MVKKLTLDAQKRRTLEVKKTNTFFCGSCEIQGGLGRAIGVARGGGAILARLQFSAVPSKGGEFLGRKNAHFYHFLLGARSKGTGFFRLRSEKFFFAAFCLMFGQ